MFFLDGGDRFAITRLISDTIFLKFDNFAITLETHLSSPLAGERTRRGAAEPLYGAPTLGSHYIGFVPLETETL